MLGSDLGKAVVANAATQILLRQASQAIDEITQTFDLSAGERAFLLSADRGQGLLSAGTQRVAFQSIASPDRALPGHQQPGRTRRLRRHRPSRVDEADAAFVDLGVDDHRRGRREPSTVTSSAPTATQIHLDAA